MPASAAKKPGDQVRVRRKDGETFLLENDWTFVRFEPDSGNMVAEKGGKRVICARGECLLLNFPASDTLWSLIVSEPEDDNLRAAEQAWAKLDLPKAVSCLLAYGRTLDPSFRGIQTGGDFASKTRSLAESCESALTLLKMEMKRAETEYNRCPVGTAFDNDRKDELLDAWRDLQAKYAAKAYCRDRLLPACRDLIACLKGIEEAKKPEA